LADILLGGGREECWYPKSPILTLPSFVIKMLAGLRSRWIIGGCRQCNQLQPF